MNRSKLAFLGVLMILCTYVAPILAGELRKLGISDVQLGPSNSTWTSSGGATVRYFPYPYAGAGTSATDNSAVIDVRAYGFGEGIAAATNGTALQAAFDNAAALGSGGIPVFIPGGGYNITGTIDTKGVPFYGVGPEKTKFFPTTDVPLFDITLSHGIAGGFSINYVNVGTHTSPAIRLKSVTQCRLEAIVIWNHYRGMQVTSGYGDGYIWQVEFDHIIGSGLTDYLFYIDSSSDSTTLKFSNCHNYGSAGVGRGWYLINVTTSVLSNCSMDFGDNTVNGAIIYANNYQNVSIDTFHLEGFTQTVGGLSASPFNFEAGYVHIGNIVLPTYTVDVGAGNTGYLIRSAAYSTIIGNIEEVSPVTTSGTKRYLNSTGYSVRVLSRYADPTMYVHNGSNPDRMLVDNNIFYSPYVKTYYGASVDVDNTAYVNLLLVPPISDLTARKNAGLFIVKGSRAGSGAGWTDLIALVTAIDGATSIAAVSSNNEGSPPARTYDWNSDYIRLTTDSATVYTARIFGWGISAD